MASAVSLISVAAGATWSSRIFAYVARSLDRAAALKAGSSTPSR